MKFKFIAMTKAKPGREAEFRDWYLKTHLDDVFAIPAIRTAQLFEIAQVRKDSLGNGITMMAEYDCEAESPQVIVDELNARQASGQMPLTDAADPTGLGYFFKPLTELKVK